MSTQIIFLFLWMCNHCDGFLPTYDKFCVSHSLIPSDVEGTYEYSYFSSNTNATVYYNNEISQYLYPWIENNSHGITKLYIIGKDPSTHHAHSYCTVSEFNPFSCTKGWVSWNSNTTVQNWTDDTNMRLTNCNDICITDDTSHTHYIWDHFDIISNVSVFNNTRYSSIYLHAMNGNYFIYNMSSLYNISDTLHVGPCASSCFNGIQTPFYGEMIPQKEEQVFNEGKISEIVSWAVYNDSSYVVNHCIGYLQYKTNEITSDIIGSGGGPNAPYFAPCPPFVLDTHDYINGYRVIYDEYVYGLTFYTFNGKMHNCNASDLNYSKYHDSGVIYDDNYYLSGFNIYVEWIIDSISFQFKSIHNCTNEPTIDPTVNPSVLPTSHPTIVPSTNPTYNPTYFSTLLPTYYPSYFSTLLPTYHPTVIPTVEPIFYSTQTPSYHHILEVTTPPAHTPTLYSQIVDVTTIWSTVMNTIVVDDVVTNKPANTKKQFILLMVYSVAVVAIFFVIGIIIGKSCGKKDKKERKVAKADVKEHHLRMSTNDKIISRDGMLTRTNTTGADIDLASVPTAKLSQHRSTTSKGSRSFESTDSSALYVVHNEVDDTTMGYQGE